jgi:hypothetical protein
MPRWDVASTGHLTTCSLISPELVPDDAPPNRGPTRLRPTVIGPIAPGQKTSRRPADRASPPVSEHATRPVVAPTAIPGVERRRIAVTVADIARLSPGVAPAVAATAVRLVEGFVVEGARDRTITLWGHGAQQEYADLVARTLDLARADELGRVRAYVTRMIDLLGAIDLPVICGIGRPAGVFDRLFGGTGRIDTLCALEDARAELDQLVRLTAAALDPLLRLRDRLSEQARRIEATGGDIEAAALAAGFLADHLSITQPALSQRFLERAMSLTRSVAQLRGDDPLRAAQAEQPLHLIAAIQEAVLVAMPAWLSTIAALTATASGARSPNPTEAGELQHRLQTILQQLKT